MAGVPCEQLVWSWNQVTLAETGAGYGPIQRSPGWPWTDPSDPAGGLGGRTRYLATGFENLLADHTPPVSLSLDRLAEGPLAVRKSFLGKDAFGRNSRWLVQAALDVTGRLHPADVLSADDAGLFDAEVDRAGVPVRTDLPALVLPEAPPPLARLNAFEILLSRLVPALLLIRQKPQFAPLVVRASSSSEVAALLTALISVLPREFSRSLTFTTFDAQPATADVEIAGAIEPFSADIRQDPDRLWLDLIGSATNFPEPSADEAAITAELLTVSRAGERPPDDLATLAELETWVRSRALLRQAPSSLSGVEVAELLAHPAAVQWLSSPDAWTAVVTVLEQDAEYGPVVARTLRPVLVAAPAAQFGTWSGDLIHRLGAALLAGANSDAWQIVADELGDLLSGGPDELAQRIASETTVTLRQGFSGSSPVDPWLVSVIARHSATMDDSDRMRWLSQPGVAQAAAQGDWSPLSRELVVATLRGHREWVAPFIYLVERLPVEVCDLLDESMRQHQIEDGNLLQLARDLPVESLSVMFDLLAAAHQVEPGFLLFDVLADPRLEPEPVRKLVLGPLLQRHWSTLGRAANLPPAVVATLDVRRELQGPSTGSAAADGAGAEPRHDGDLTVAGEWGPSKRTSDGGTSSGSQRSPEPPAPKRRWPFGAH